MGVLASVSQWPTRVRAQVTWALPHVGHSLPLASALTGGAQAAWALKGSAPNGHLGSFKCLGPTWPGLGSLKSLGPGPLALSWAGPTNRADSICRAIGQCGYHNSPASGLHAVLQTGVLGKHNQENRVTGRIGSMDRRSGTDVAHKSFSQTSHTTRKLVFSNDMASNRASQ